MSEISKENFQKLTEDLIQVKNDVNTIKANTQLNANILSLIHSSDIIDVVFDVANSERLCKALIVCKKPTTAKELCDALSIKQPNIRRDVLSKLLDKSLLILHDDKARRESYLRVGYLDLIGFDKLAVKKYPNLKEIV